MKTATDRAADAVEAADMMFADEMGVALDLCPAAKAALVVKIAAPIEAASEESANHGRDGTPVAARCSPFSCVDERAVVEVDGGKLVLFGPIILSVLPFGLVAAFRQQVPFENSSECN